MTTVSYGWSVAAVRGRVDLVQEQASLVDLAEVDERDRAPLPAAQLEPHVAVLAADPLRRRAELPRRLVVVRRHRRQSPLQREIAVGDPLGLVLEQALGPRQPAAADRLLQPDAAVLVRELDGDGRGARIVLRGDVPGVRALEDRNDLDDLVGEVRAPGEQLEILRPELVVRGGRGEQVVTLAPAPRGDRRAPGGDAIEDVGHAPILAHPSAGKRRRVPVAPTAPAFARLVLLTGP